MKVKDGCPVSFGEMTLTPLQLTQTSSNVFYFIDEVTGLMVIFGDGATEEYSKNTYTSYSWYSKANEIKYLIFEKGITSVKQYSFYSVYKNLINIRFGSTITTIGKEAFQGDSGIKILFIPENVNKFDYGVFDMCTSLETVHIKSTTLTLGYFSFYRCTSLKTVYYYSSTPPTCQTSSIYVCEGVQFCTAHPDCVPINPKAIVSSSYTSNNLCELTVSKELW